MPGQIGNGEMGSGARTTTSHPVKARVARAATAPIQAPRPSWANSKRRSAYVHPAIVDAAIVVGRAGEACRSRAVETTRLVVFYAVAETRPTFAADRHQLGFESKRPLGAHCDFFDRELARIGSSSIHLCGNDEDNGPNLFMKPTGPAHLAQGACRSSPTRKMAPRSAS